jgi:hypothetical protein
MWHQRFCKQSGCEKQRCWQTITAMEDDDAECSLTTQARQSSANQKLSSADITPDHDQQQQLHSYSCVSESCLPSLRHQLLVALHHRKSASCSIPDTIFSRNLDLFKQSPPRLHTRSSSTGLHLPRVDQDFNSRRSLERTSSAREVRSEYLKARMAFSTAGIKAFAGPELEGVFDEVVRLQCLTAVPAYFSYPAWSRKR